MYHTITFSYLHDNVALHSYRSELTFYNRLFEGSDSNCGGAASENYDTQTARSRARISCSTLCDYNNVLPLVDQSLTSGQISAIA